MALGAEVLTAGTGTSLILGAKAARLGSVTNGALRGAVGAAAGTGVQAIANPHVGGTEVIAGTVLGAGFGAVVGKLMGNPGARQEASEIQKIMGGQPDTTPTVRAGLSAGAAQNPAVVMPELDDAAIRSIRDEDAPKTFAGFLRMDLEGRIKSSPNPAARLILGSLARDAAGNAEDVVQGFSRTEDMTRLFDSWNVDLAHSYQPQLKAYLRTQRASGARLSSEELTTQFHDQVHLFIVDRGASTSDFDPAVVQLGTKIRQIHAAVRENAANPLLREGQQGRAVAGFGDLEDNPHYLMRVFDARKVQDFSARFGDNGLQKVFASALRGTMVDMDDAKILKLAKGFAGAVKSRAIGLEELDPVNFSEDGLAALRKTLMDESGMDEADVDAILSPLQRKAEASGTPRGKRRMFLDETTKAEVLDANGMATEASLRDLVVTDAYALTTRYIRQMAGAVSMARWRVYHPRTGELLVNGVTNQTEFEQALRVIRQYGHDAGVDQRVLKSDEKKARFLYDYVMGRPTHATDDTAFGDWLNVVQGLNYSRLMGQVGFAQIPEIAGTITRLGLKATFSHVPAFRRLITTDTGEALLENGFARDLETFMHAGIDRFTRADFHRTDDLSGSPHSLTRGGAANKALGTVNKLNRWTSTMSGMDLVDGFSKKATAAAIVQKFVDVANGSGSLSRPWLHQMGMSDEMAERVMASLRDPRNVQTSTGSLTKSKVQRLKMDWSDKEAFAAFQDTALRISSQLIQKNDIGMMHEWMSTPMGRIIFQFRKFMVGSFTNHLLFNANMARRGDLRTVNFAILSSMLAGSVYVAQEKIRAIGRSDREEYLDRRLTWDNIAKASFARSGYSSIIPMLIDSPPISFVTGGGVFDYRSTGQPSSIFGNPTFSLMDDLQKGVRGAVAPVIDGRGMSQEEARSFARMVPLGNTLPAIVGMSGLIQGMDERPPRQYRD